MRCATFEERLNKAIQEGMDLSDFEAVQEAEQKMVFELDLLPVEMAPNMAAFLKLGFHFNAIEDTVLIGATLPKGWQKKRVEDSGYDGLYVQILDEYGRVRAHYTYWGAVYNRYGNMKLD